MLLFYSYQKSLPTEKQGYYDSTIQFLEQSSKLIEVFHSYIPITNLHDDRFDESESVLLWFQNWQAEVSNAPGTLSERRKMFMSEKTFFDLKSMVLGFRQLCKETFREHSSVFILPWRINTNLVENIFCQQRGLHGQNDNPRYIQYQNGINSVLMGCRTSTTKSNTGGG